MSRILFYALGGGFGHLMRTRHLVTELKKNPTVESLVLCPTRTQSFAARFSAHAAIGDVGRAALGGWFQRQLERFAPDLVVMDTFPRGVLGEVVMAPGLRRLLLTRWVAPDYYRTPKVREALDCFHQVCWTEPRSDQSFPGHNCEPILSPEPPLPREQARKVLGVDGRPLVLGLGSGGEAVQREVSSKLLALGEERDWNVRWFSRELGTGRPGVAGLLKGADVIVSASGYNSYYEIARVGVPALFLPQDRKVDDQLLRARGTFPFAVDAATRVHSADDDFSQSLQELIVTRHRASTAREPRGRRQVAKIVMEMLGCAALKAERTEPIDAGRYPREWHRESTVRSL